MEKKYSLGQLLGAVVVTAVLVAGGMDWFMGEVASDALQFEEKVEVSRQDGSFNYIRPVPAEADEDPLVYDLEGLPVIVGHDTRPFDYTLADMKSLALECGNEPDDEYLGKLLAGYEGALIHEYSFAYTGLSNMSAIFTVEVMPNRAGYINMDEFGKDFDLCAAGSPYPYTMNNDWLAFTSSCGGAAVDSPYPIGCNVAREAVLPTLGLK